MPDGSEEEMDALPGGETVAQIPEQEQRRLAVKIEEPGRHGISTLPDEKSCAPSPTGG